MIEPKNPIVHVYAGNLLMTTGSYDDAAKAFSNADQVKKCALAIYQRARCNIALSEIDEAMQDLTNVIKLNPHDKIAFTDKECLHAITKAMNIFKLNLDKEEQMTEIGKLAITVTRTHAQIIPNVRRIKLEKVRMAAYMRRKEKDKYVAEFKGTKDVPTRDYYESDEKIIRGAELITPYSYYKENIFSEEDFYLYRGVMFFYSGQYEKASKDFHTSMVKKEENKDENENSDTDSETSNQTDLSDVGLCSLNIHESKYNQAL
jgi:tetratricopeptide (TPR) repeat protein